MWLYVPNEPGLGTHGVFDMLVYMKTNTPGDKPHVCQRHGWTRISRRFSFMGATIIAKNLQYTIRYNDI